MYERYWIGLYASTAFHVLAILTCLIAAAQADRPLVPGRTRLAAYPEPPLTQVEVTLLGAPGAAAGRAARAPERVL